MEPRLTRGEYWLLNCVVEAGCPLRFLVSDSIEELFNNPGHRLERLRLIDTLVGMAESGWIKADCDDEDLKLDRDLVGVAFEEGFDPKRSEESVYYRLTAEGGSIWEQFAAPNWDRYLRTWKGRPGELNHFFGATKWRLEKYLALVHHLGTKILPESVEWSEVQPWQATYWKVLPLGYCVQCRHMQADERINWDCIPHSLMSLQKWYDWD